MLGPCEVARSIAALLWLAAVRPSPETTLSQVRAAITHETKSKLVRLEELVRAWREGRYRPSDPADLVRILDDVRSVSQSHARLSAARFRSLLLLARIRTLLRATRRCMRPARLGRPLPAGALARLARLIAGLRAADHRHIEEISGRFARRLCDLAIAATDEIRREQGGGLAPGSVRIVLEDLSDEGCPWVPRAERERWLDILRNLIRNAVQATRDREASSAPGAALASPPAVTVRLRPLPTESGAVLEVLDDGIGMSPEQVASMWQDGSSRHGGGRGRGLIEEKRLFLEARARLEVRSARGVGTVVRLDVPQRTIAIAAVRPWQVRPFVAGALLLAALVAGAAHQGGQAELGWVELRQEGVLEARDRRGRFLSRVDLGEEVLPYRPDGGVKTPGAHDVPCLLRRDGRGRVQGVIVATTPERGPGSLWFLDGRLRVERKLALDMRRPRELALGRFLSYWQAFIPWGPRGETALAVSIRDHVYAEFCVLFLDAGRGTRGGAWGDTLGCYYHHGHLSFVAAADFDGDGSSEILLAGINNSAQADTTFLSEDPGVFIDCLILLRTPGAGGQAYPWTTWEGVPPAREAGYVLLPPLRAGLRPQISLVDLMPSFSPDAPAIVAHLVDGRIYYFNWALRPLRCGTGTVTLVRALALDSAIGPLIYFHDGEREEISLPVDRSRS